MNIKNFLPRTGAGSLRIADSDELVVMEHFSSIPTDRVRPWIMASSLSVLLAQPSSSTTALPFS